MRRLFIFLVVFCTGCQLAGQTGRFPASCPADLKLIYHYDGGMRYYSEEFLVSKDSCVFEKNDGGKKKRNKFILTNAEFNAFYAMLKANQFDKIIYTTETGVHDRGGISMDFTWDKSRQQIRVSNAQMSFVKERWIKEWQAVCDYLLNMISKKATK